MDWKRILPGTLVAAGVAFGLFVLMGMNVTGWMAAVLGMGLESANIAGIVIFVGLTFFFAWLWIDMIGENNTFKKLPGPAAGAIYGIAVSAFFIWLIPLILFSLAGEPSITHDGGDVAKAFTTTFGAHRVVPRPLMDDAPMKNMTTSDWIEKAQWKSRLLPFGIAFIAFGATLGFFSGGKGGKD